MPAVFGSGLLMLVSRVLAYEIGSYQPTGGE